MDDELTKKKRLVVEYQKKINELNYAISTYQNNELTRNDTSNDMIQTQLTIEEELKLQSTTTILQDKSQQSAKSPKSQSSVLFDKQRSELPSVASHSKFSWHNINVYVNNNNILCNISGSIVSGELMAIMGGSGAGKSTLLNILSGRTNLNQQRVTGYLSINNKKFKCTQQNIIKSLCSFVPQSDILCDTQTVYEALLFYAKLKLINKNLKKQIKRIKYLINVLHLNKCCNNIIGDSNETKNGISGGERRRVSIASEIINDVDIIFLDEPTSGLDAYTASATIKTLKEFCTVSNKIIVATIHQPSIETFYLFDKLILLSSGKCCFNSSINDIDIFFKNSLKPKTNPADVIIFEIQQNTDKYTAKWNESSLNIYKNDNYLTYSLFTTTDLKENKNNLSRASYISQLILLLVRELQSLYRNRRLTFIRLIQVIFFSLACGCIFYDISESFSERAKCHFLLTLIPLLFGMVSLLVVFPKQKHLFQREYSSNTYSSFTFALSYLLIEIPREIIHMFIFVVICYPLINFDGNIWNYWINLFLCSFSGGSFGMVFGSISSTTSEAAQLVPASLIPLLMFSDGIIPIVNLPAIIKWIAYIDPLYYLMRCFFIIEFNNVTYERELSDDDEYLCNKYSYSNNYTDYNFINITNLNCSFTSVNIDYNITQILNNNNNNDNAIQTTTTTTSTTTSTLPIYNITTTLSESIQKINDYCREEISSDYFFDSKHLNPNNLYNYWLYIFIICICLRIISMLILYSINNNYISYLYNIKTKILNYLTKNKKNKKNNSSNNNDNDNDLNDINLTLNDIFKSQSIICTINEESDDENNDTMIIKEGEYEPFTPRGQSTPL